MKRSAKRARQRELETTISALKPSIDAAAATEDGNDIHSEFLARFSKSNSAAGSKAAVSQTGAIA